MVIFIMCSFLNVSTSLLALLRFVSTSGRVHLIVVSHEVGLSGTAVSLLVLLSVGATSERRGEKSILVISTSSILRRIPRGVGSVTSTRATSVGISGSQVSLLQRQVVGSNALLVVTLLRLSLLFKLISVDSTGRVHLRFSLVLLLLSSHVLLLLKVSHLIE